MAQRLSIIPFQNVDRRTLWLRLTLLNACFLGMIASAPLWTNVHTFPLLRIVPGFPILPAPWDKILFGAMLLSLIAAAWFYHAAVRFFLIASLFAYCEDENRGQPWLYMYWVMLLLTLFPPGTAIAACRWGMFVVYIWSGIQKCNARFFHNIPPWFVGPAENWHLSPMILEAMRRAVAHAPYVEIGIGLALWLPRLRPAVIAAAIVVHGSALLFLGPLGYNYNWVVWPWNLAMLALLWVLFAKGDYWRRRTGDPVPAPAVKEARGAKKNAPAKASGSSAKKSPAASASDATLSRTFAELWRSKLALAVLALYSLLPILSYSGKWDSYFSFALYSESAATANIFMTQEFADRLPERLKAHAQVFPQAFDPQHQGPLLFNYGAWCYEELHVPPIAEPRNFVSIFKTLQTWSVVPSDLRMMVGQRGGPVVFYEGQFREFLMPN